MGSRSQNTSIYLLILLIVTAGFIILGVSYFKNSKATDGNKTTEENSSQPENNNQNNNNALTNDQKLYSAGIQSIENKKYNDAISQLGQAIAENPDVVSYYTLKSEAEVLAGKTADAKATLEAGLKIDPESEILNSKLDALNKDYFAPANQDTPKL